MAAKKRKTSKKKARKGGSVAQRFLVALAGLVMTLCVASVTFGFFIRHSGGNDRGSQLRIEVLNGTGQRGLAEEARRGLLHRGIDVISVANAEHFDYDESVLIARKKSVDVRELGELLGCRNVIEQVRDDSLEDATLILGADYKALRLEWAGGSGSGD